MKKYTVKEYIGFLQEAGVSCGGAPSEITDTTVELVSCDSQTVRPGTLFLCKGAHFRAEYLRDAVEKGAFCYIAEQPYAEVDVPCLVVDDVRRAMAVLANRYYNEPWKDLHVIGLTGTKGKSSTAYYIKAILDDWMQESGGSETGLISSIDTYDGVERFESHITTPEPLELEERFAHARDAGIRYLTMEVSSQALKYDRVLGVQLAIGCFLNIGYDHVSPIEHPDFADYLQSKLRIFAQCDTAVVNLDAEHAEEVLAAAKSAGTVITFSEHDETADVYGFAVQSEEGGIRFRVRQAEGEMEIRLGMPGLFNVSNALAAISVARALGVPKACIQSGLLRARVPGRMEVYTSADNRVVVIVDYAHNKLSFEALFASAAKEYPGRRIVSIFGSVGKKAFDRRRDLAEIAGKQADYIYITEDDPGEEDVAHICEDIAGHVKKTGCPHEIILDRGEAIATAIGGVQEPTVILLTGKGAETREKRGIEFVPVPSDVEYTQEALRAYDAEHS